MYSVVVVPKLLLILPKQNYKIQFDLDSNFINVSDDHGRDGSYQILWQLGLHQFWVFPYESLFLLHL
jgi:hypothetical protein